ncbi:SsgA family sporulation/cell division regulator [Streptomyces sp. NPDC101209]|uniref:SsgA family sporulation/cell division regulator n=1 Tax=Streptomyces sp. NPDC101209 TaxID=3366129 RepID=UPI00380EC6BF
MREDGESATTLVRGVTVSVGVPGEPVVQLSAELCYDMADPYAVRLSLGAPEVESVDWVFARSLLEEGLHRPTGVGSVLVSPPDRWHDKFVRIVVRSIEGAARIDIPVIEALEFLRQSHALVPTGGESLHIRVDHELAVLMGSCE